MRERSKEINNKAPALTLEKCIKANYKTTH